MPLQFQVKNIPVVGGMEQGVDELSLQTGQLKSAKNIRYKKDGLADKRAGLTQVSTATDFSGGFGAPANQSLTAEGRLVSDGSRLYMVDGRAVHLLTSGPKKWSTKSLAPRYTGTSKSMGGSNKGIAHHSQCVASDGTNLWEVIGYTEHQASGPTAWGGAAIVRVFAYGTHAEANTTGTLPSVTPANTFQLNSADKYVHCLHLVPAGTKVVAIYGSAAAAGIAYRILDLTTMAWGAENTLVADNSNLGGIYSCFDAKPTPDGKVVFLYQTGGWLIKAQRYTVGATTLTLANTVTVQDLSAGPVNLASGFGIAAGTNYTWASWGYDNGTNLKGVIRAIDTTTWATAGALVVGSGVDYTGLQEVNGDYVVASACYQDPTDPTSCYVGWTHLCGWSGGNLASDMALGHVHYGTTFNKATVNAGPTLVVSARATFGRAKIVSTPFLDTVSSRCFCVMERSSGFHVANAQLGIFGNASYPVAPAANVGSRAANQSTVFVGDVINGVEDCVFFPRQSYLTADAGATQYYPYKLTVQYFDQTYKYFTIPTFDQLYKRSSVNLVTLTTSDKYRYQSYDSEEGVYLSGGFPGYIDGRGFSPLGFCNDPGYITAKSGGGAALSGTATACFEYVDKDGNVQRTDIAAPITFSGTVPITLRTGYLFSGWDYLQSTNRAAYSLPVGETMVVFYAGATSDQMREVYRTEVFPSQAIYAAAGVTVSSSAFSALPSNSETSPFVYTYGGFLPADCPPAFVGMTQHGGRLFGVDHTQRTIWFSKVLVRGERAQFSQDQTIDVPFDAEAIFGMDGTLYIFGRNTIGYVQGDGPNANGDGGTFSDVVILSSDLGVTDSRSIVRTPSGLIFRSPIGFQLLDRSGKVNYIGTEVVDLQALYPNTRSAIQHPVDNVVMFAVDNGSTGVRIVYNYLYERWSYDTIGVGGGVIQSQASVGNSLYTLMTDGTVWLEDSTIGTDGGNFVTSELEFASEKPGGVQAQHRFHAVSVLGTRRGNVDLNVSVAFDDDSSYAYTQLFQQNSLTSSMVNAQMYPARKLGRSIRIKVSDAFPTGAGAAYNNGLGLRISGVGLEFGVYDNMNRVDSGKRK